MADIVTGSFTATGQSASFSPDTTRATQPGMFNYSLQGTFVATLQLERLLPGETVWQPLTALGNTISYNSPCSETWEECEADVSYRWNCTAYTSGTINYRMGER
jgi:hypothetical protein